jgi:hypothetical protein
MARERRGAGSSLVSMGAFMWNSGVFQPLPPNFRTSCCYSSMIGNWCWPISRINMMLAISFNHPLSMVGKQPNFYIFETTNQANIELDCSSCVTYINQGLVKPESTNRCGSSKYWQNQILTRHPPCELVHPPTKCNASCENC